MKTTFRFLGLLAVLALALLALPALAGETGSISGKVTDANGGPLPGVLVKVVGPQLPAGRTVSTSATGAYNFQQLIPGRYTVTAELQGLGRASKTLDVQVDIDVQVSLSLRGGAAATAEVVATSVDARATEVSSNFQSAEIRTLPISRTYEGFINLIPGAAASLGSGYVSVAGGTTQENKYLVDGVNITNPGYGYLGVATNELDIADVNIKTGAISAESGRTNGVIVNAVTKSGTNEVHGTVRGELSPSSFQADRDFGVQRDTDQWNSSAGVGFPLMKDSLFGYASGRYASATTTGQSATIGGVTTTQPDTKSTAGDYFGKLTGYLGQSFLLNAGFRGLPNKADNAFDSSYDAASAASNAHTTNYVWNVTANWFLNKNAYLEAKYVHLTENDTYQAANVLGSRPANLDLTAPLGTYGRFADPARNGGNSGVYPYANGGEAYRRDEIKLTASQFLDIGPTQHQIKVGGGAEFTDYDFIRQSNGWGTLTYSSSTEIRARYYDLQPKQVGQSRTYSAFIQDTITWNRLSLNLGVLANYDDFSQTCKAGSVCGSTIAVDTTRFNFMTFRWKQQIQPRLGLVYNTELLTGDKAYVNYGEYAGTDQKSTVRSFAPYRIREDQTYFSRATGQWLRDQIRGSSGGKYIPPDLPSPYSREFVLGYAAPFKKDFSFDVHYMYKDIQQPFEDAPIDPNKYFGSFQAVSYPDAVRIYRGLTLELSKRYSNGWYANLSYTYSTLEGNWDEEGGGTGSYNTSSYLEDEPGINHVEANRYGRLTQDRPHVFKLMGSYDLPVGFQVGGFFRIQSGAPWEARGYTPSGVVYRYLEPAGSNRLPTETSFDLLAAWNHAFANGMSLRLEGRVQNLFNSQTVESVNRLQYLDSYKDGVPTSQLGPQGTTQPNPLFGTATSWTAPRRFVVSALFNF